jgi:hypothetical protein
MGFLSVIFAISAIQQGFEINRFFPEGVTPCVLPTDKTDCDYAVVYSSGFTLPNEVEQMRRALKKGGMGLIIAPLIDSCEYEPFISMQYKDRPDLDYHYACFRHFNDFSEGEHLEAIKYLGIPDSYYYRVYLQNFAEGFRCEILGRYGFTARFSGEHELIEWIRAEVVLLIEISESEQESFIEDYLTRLKQFDCGSDENKLLFVCKQCVMQLEKE